NVHYTQSSTDSTSVKIYGPDNYLELIEVAIADSTLMISMKKKQLKNVSRMKIMIATPNLNAVRLKGVGNIYINEPLTTPSLSIKNEGVGNIVVKELKSESVWIKTEGVGNVDISGESGKAVLLSKGIGNLKAGSLKCEEAEVVSEGIGNVSCYATGKLSATSRGIGNIRYKGSPKETKINKSGIGSIKPD
ncbi:DUF2807 domain-containing protein, partial [Bacteroides sp. OttesenSCG-928-F21]|nr:DUF2807 domain-containing protein [Bacteroides sp. OttesenSCG-928-F21]